MTVRSPAYRAAVSASLARLLGRANWWAPGPLRRLYARYGIRDDDGDASAPLAQPAATVRSGSC